MKRKDQPKTGFVLARRNLKVKINHGQTKHVSRRIIVILETADGSSFVHHDSLKNREESKIVTGDNMKRIREAYNRPLHIKGSVIPQVNLEMKDEKVTFYVAEQLVAPIILGCDLCSKNFDAKQPRKCVVLMDDGTYVPLVWRPTRSSVKWGPPKEQIFAPLKERTSKWSSYSLQ